MEVKDRSKKKKNKMEVTDKWYKATKNVSLDDAKVKQFIGEYLVFEGHVEAALAFHASSDTVNKLFSRQELEALVQIKMGIMSRNMDLALEAFEATFSEPKAEKLIDLFMESRLQEAIQYSQTNFGPILVKQPSMIPLDFKRVMALSMSPGNELYKDLTEEANRPRTLKKVITSLSEQRGHIVQDPQLVKCLKMLVHLEN